MKYATSGSKLHLRRSIIVTLRLQTYGIYSLKASNVVATQYYAEMRQLIALLESSERDECYCMNVEIEKFVAYLCNSLSLFCV